MSKFLTYFQDLECYEILNLKETNASYIISSESFPTKKRLKKEDYNNLYFIFDVDAEDWRGAYLERYKIITELIDQEVDEYIKKIIPEIDSLLETEKEIIKISAKSNYYLSYINIKFPNSEKTIPFWKLRNWKFSDADTYESKKQQLIIDTLAKKYNVLLQYNEGINNGLHYYLNPKYLSDIDFSTGWSSTLLYVLINKVEKISITPCRSSENNITLDDLLKFRPDLFEKFENEYLEKTDSLIITGHNTDIFLKTEDTKISMKKSYLNFPFFNKIMKKSEIKISIYGISDYYLSEKFVFDHIRIKENKLCERKSQGMSYNYFSKLNNYSSDSFISQLKHQLGRDKFNSLLLLSEIEEKEKEND